MTIKNRVNRVVDKLKHGEPEERKSAAIQLGRIRDPITIPALMEALDDEYPLTRVFALQSLSWLGDRQIIPTMLRIARKDSDTLVRVTAIDILKSFGDTRVIDDLISISIDKSITNDVRTAASVAVEELLKNSK